MYLSLIAHDEGCTPLDPCRGCNAIAFLRENLQKADFETFKTRCRETGFSPDKHNPGCSPIMPCANCVTLKSLENSFKNARGGFQGKFQEFLLACDDKHLPPDASWDRDAPDADMAGNRPLSDIEMSVRPSNILKKVGILTVDQLARCTSSELMRLEDFGQKSLDEIRAILSALGRKLADPDG